MRQKYLSRIKSPQANLRWYYLTLIRQKYSISCETKIFVQNKSTSRKFGTVLFNINEMKVFWVLRHIYLNLLSQNDFCHFCYFLQVRENNFHSSETEWFLFSLKQNYSSLTRSVAQVSKTEWFLSFLRQSYLCQTGLWWKFFQKLLSEQGCIHNSVLQH